ncbi:MAG: ectonucleotide pyrophosphatase/phosphodiesterase [Sphingomonas sp.]|jgi:predicted AlkP superfamily pyrophosphatase or phosphodiesterase
MRFTPHIFLIALATLLLGCTTVPAAPLPLARTLHTPASAQTPMREPVTILVSIDGFRPDYLTRGVTPNLNALAASGISGAMRPSFPSVTFPNHWTLVTGLRPDRHGIVGNRMEDTRRGGEVFTMQSEDSFWWDAAEPLWITAENAGVRSATMFWPGSSVALGGKRPSDWQQFGHEVNNRQRVDAIVDWLRRPAATRPRFLTLYFDTVDSAGHKYGPDDARTTAAVADIDTAIAQLRAGLAELGQPANLVIVADHGMAATGPDRVILLNTIASPASYRVVTAGSYAGIEPQAGHEAELASALARPNDHMRCWPKAQIPPALHYGHNARVPSFICLAQPGWLILEKAPPADRPITAGGAHGYDGASPEMAALFIANGPAIAAHGPLPAFDNVDVAPLVRHLLGLPPGTGLDGNDAPFRPALRQ